MGKVFTEWEMHGQFIAEARGDIAETLPAEATMCMLMVNRYVVLVIQFLAETQWLKEVRMYLLMEVDNGGNSSGDMVGC
jgi:hypothetical protein